MDFPSEWKGGWDGMGEIYTLYYTCIKYGDYRRWENEEEEEKAQKNWEEEEKESPTSSNWPVQLTSSADWRSVAAALSIRPDEKCWKTFPLFFLYIFFFPIFSLSTLFVCVSLFLFLFWVRLLYFECAHSSLIQRRMPWVERNSSVNSVFSNTTERRGSKTVHTLTLYRRPPYRAYCAIHTESESDWV